MTKQDELDKLDELFMRVEQLKEGIIAYVSDFESETISDCEEFADFLEDASQDMMRITSAMQNLERKPE